jgi:hypothetical protein
MAKKTGLKSATERRQLAALWLSAPDQRSLSIIANFDTFKDPVLGRGGLNVATTAACSRVRLDSDYSISKRYGEEDHVYTMVAILLGRCPQSRRKHPAMR